MQEIGARIRALRKDRGLSLEGLAEKCGVASSALSRIENGKGGGTYRTHKRIADALRISIAELYQGMEEPEAEVVVTRPEPQEAETFTYDEKASAVLLTSQSSHKNMLPQLIILQPGGQTAVEQYPAGTERWILCSEGEIDATVGGKSYRIVQGGTLYLKASLPHQLKNANGGISKVISVTSPAVL